MSTALELHLGFHPRWEERYESLTYSALALGAYAGDGPLDRCFSELRGVLADWERIDAERRALRAQAIGARTAVRVADAALDRILHRIATAVRQETGGDDASALHQRLFPEPPERVIALGLDAELPLASLVMAQLDDGDVPASVAAEKDALRGCLVAGNGALSQRADAYAELGRLQARIEAWLESADAALATLHADLAAIANERGLGARWPRTFFPA